MPHYCRICSCFQPNERFSGKGHRIHVCRTCQGLPRDQRAAIDAEQEICSFLFRQSHISSKNLKRLRLHCTSQDPDIARMAAAVLAAAIAAPYKRKRFSILRRHHPHILEQLAATDLFFNNGDYENFDDFDDFADLFMSEADASILANDSGMIEDEALAPSNTSYGIDLSDDIPFALTQPGRRKRYG